MFEYIVELNNGDFNDYASNYFKVYAFNMIEAKKKALKLEDNENIKRIYKNRYIGG